jgi:hypothetical protein
LYDQIQQLLLYEIERLRKELQQYEHTQTPQALSQNTQILSEIGKIEAETSHLQQISDLLEEQHSQNQEQFLAIQKRDRTSARQNIWLTIVSSTISLIIGWLLSLFGSPINLLGFLHNSLCV